MSTGETTYISQDRFAAFEKAQCELTLRHFWLRDAPLTLGFLAGIGGGIDYYVRLLANSRQNVGRDRGDSLGRSTITQVYLPCASIALLLVEIAGTLEVHDNFNPIFSGTGLDLAPRVVEAWATGKLRGKYVPLAGL